MGFVTVCLGAVFMAGCSDASPDASAGPDDSSAVEDTASSPPPTIEVVEGPPLTLVRSANAATDSRPASLVTGTVVVDGDCLSLRSEPGDIAPLLLPPGSVVNQGTVELPDGSSFTEDDELEAEGFWMPTSELAIPLPACSDAESVAFVFAPE